MNCRDKVRTILEAFIPAKEILKALEEIEDLFEAELNNATDVLARELQDIETELKEATDRLEDLRELHVDEHELLMLFVDAHREREIAARKKAQRSAKPNTTN